MTSFRKNLNFIKTLNQFILKTDLFVFNILFCVLIKRSGISMEGIFCTLKCFYISICVICLCLLSRFFLLMLSRFKEEILFCNGSCNVKRIQKYVTTWPHYFLMRFTVTSYVKEMNILHIMGLLKEGRKSCRAKRYVGACMKG